MTLGLLNSDFLFRIRIESITTNISEISFSMIINAYQYKHGFFPYCSVEFLCFFSEKKTNQSTFEVVMGTPSVPGLESLQKLPLFRSNQDVDIYES